MKLSLVISVLLIPAASFAADPVEKLLPLPNTTTKVKCGADIRTTTTGSLYRAPGSSSKSLRINTRTTSVNGSEQATLETWNRFALMYSAWEKGSVVSYAKMTSGDLDKMDLTLGKTYTGQVSQTLTRDKITTTEHWSINIKVQHVKTVQFNGESTAAFFITMQRQKISGTSAFVTAEFLYMPKYNQAYSVKVSSPSQKKPAECLLLETQPTPAATPAEKK